MFMIDEMINLSLIKSRTGWQLRTTDRFLNYLKNKEYVSTNDIVEHFVINVNNTYGLQGTSYQVLDVRKELVANWFLEEKI